MFFFITLGFYENKIYYIFIYLSYVSKFYEHFDNLYYPAICEFLYCFENNNKGFRVTRHNNTYNFVLLDKRLES